MTNSWQTPTLLNGLSNYNGTTKYKKCADIVTIDFHVKTPSANQTYVAFTLPSSYIPPQDITLLVSSGGTGSLVTYIIIDTSGNVKVSVNGSGNQYALGQVSFMV